MYLYFIKLLGRSSLRTGRPEGFIKLANSLKGHELSLKARLKLFDFASNLGMDVHKYNDILIKANDREKNFYFGDLLSGTSSQLEKLCQDTGLEWHKDLKVLDFYSKGFKNTFLNSDEIHTVDPLRPLIDFHLPRSLLVKSSDKSVRRNKRLQLEFMKNLITVFEEKKYSIRFFIQGAWGVDPAYSIYIKGGAKIICAWHVNRSNLPVDQMTHAHLLSIKYGSVPSFFTIDPVGYAGFSDYAKKSADRITSTRSEYTLREMRVLVDTIKNEITSSGLTKYGVTSDSAELNINQKYVLFVLQIPDDSVAKLCNLKTKDALRIVSNFCKKHDYMCVIRPHPKAHPNSFNLNKFRKNSHVLIDSNSSLHSSILQSEAVITCNSGVGAEALVLGKNVITFGECDYSPLTFNCGSSDELTEGLSKVLLQKEVPDNNSLTPKLFDYLYRYHVPFNDYKWIKKRICQILEDMH
jgi:hypothetical protein